MTDEEIRRIAKIRKYMFMDTTPLLYLRPLGSIQSLSIGESTKPGTYIANKFYLKTYKMIYVHFKFI